jgi:pyruvate kinase
MALSTRRGQTPILAISNRPSTARRMCLYWGVTPLESPTVDPSTEELLDFVVDWGRKHRVLESGSRIALVATSDWSAEGHDLLLVHVVP